jgi:molybdopterin molybdotransferase
MRRYPKADSMTLMPAGRSPSAAISREPPPSRLADAEAFIAKSYATAVGAEEVELRDAFGRILARDLIASADLPRFDASAVDGYAVRVADLAKGEITRLSVIGRSAAGHPLQRPVAPGEAARIFTGAMLPAGADLVLMQEDCRLDGKHLIIPAAAVARGNIRRRGEDMARGSVAITQGTRLGAGQLALAAALHEARLPVRRRLKVALFSTGDELRGPREEIGLGQIADANRPMLCAALAGLGCAVEDLCMLKDEPETQIATLIEAAHRSDLVVTSGGASVGDEDHLTRVIRRRGYLEIWRLKIKPGKPVALGDIDDCPILALPGNPVAAAGTFLMLGTPLIARLAGAADLRPPVIRLPAFREIVKRPGRWEALAARLVHEPGRPTAVEPLAKTGSGMLSALGAAEGFITLPEETERVAPGETVEVVLLPRA